MPVSGSGAEGLPGEGAVGAAERPPARRGGGAFISLLALAGLLLVPWLYRCFAPPRYRSTVRLRVEPLGPEPREAVAGEGDFLTQCQLLTTRQFLQRVVDRLGYYGEAELAEEDPVAELARRLSVRPVPRTRVVLVAAEGRDRLFCVRLLEELVRAFPEAIRLAEQRRAAGLEARLAREIHLLEAAGRSPGGAREAAAGASPTAGAGRSLRESAPAAVRTLLEARRRARAEALLREVVPATEVTLLDGPSPARAVRAGVSWAGMAAVAGGVAVAAALVVFFAGRRGGAAGGGVGLEVAALARAVEGLARSTRAPPPPVREGVALPAVLTGDEIASLLAATAGPLDRTLFERALMGVPTLLVNSAGPLDVAIGGLLSGLTPEEVVGLRWSQVHLEEGVVHVAGSPPRLVDLSPPVLLLFRQAQKEGRDGGELVVTQGGGRGIGVAELDALLLCTAHDAGLDRPERVTAGAIRHTFLAHLVRQGLRLADLPRVAGLLAPAVLASYGRMAPPGPGLALERVDLTPPGFQPVKPHAGGPPSGEWTVGARWEG